MAPTHIKSIHYSTKQNKTTQKEQPAKVAAELMDTFLDNDLN